MDCSRLNLLVITVSCLAILTFPIFVTGCGSSNDDDDENMSNNVVTPDQEPVSEPTPQAEAQPEPQLQPEPVLPAQPEPVPEVSFQEEILPILQARCAVQGCHADPNPRKELNLETYAGFEKGSGGGPVFNPGDSNGSKVVQRIDGGGMPPGAPLDQDQIQLFKDWIDEGAKDN
jgi:hypothetical protein